MQSKGVVFTGVNQVEFADVTCPDPGPDDVVVRVMYSWISNGTEGSYLRGERIAGDTAWRPNDPLPFPIVPGYQKVGVVEWVGERIDDVKKGEVVFAAMGRVSGMFAPAGGHVSPTVCKRNQIWKLPQGVDPVAFSGLVLTQVGYNCGSRVLAQRRTSAVVIGDGLVGQWAGQTLGLGGATTIMLGRHEDRLAKFSGRTNRLTLNTHRDGWLESLKNMLPEPPSVVVDTAGSIDAVSQVSPLLKRGGAIVSAGFYGMHDQIALQPLRAGEKSIHLVSGWSQARMDKTLELIAGGQLDTLGLITHRFAAARAAEAWQLILAKKEPVLGVVLDW